jgi:hypothetical protein
MNTEPCSKPTDEIPAEILLGKDAAELPAAIAPAFFPIKEMH